MKENSMTTYQKNPAIAVIKHQLAKIPHMLEHYVADITPQEWQTRIVPDDNMLGFIAWHLPSTMDFAVQTLIRGVPQIRHHSQWQDCPSLDTNTPPFNITMEEADSTALNSQPDNVIQYTQPLLKKF